MKWCSSLGNMKSWEGWYFSCYLQKTKCVCGGGGGGELAAMGGYEES